MSERAESRGEATPNVRTLMKSLGFAGLKCPVPGCSAVLWAYTGYQELVKLQRHYRRAHMARITLEEALELRARIERGSRGDERKAHDEG